MIDSFQSSIHSVWNRWTKKTLNSWFQKKEEHLNSFSDKDSILGKWIFPNYYIEWNCFNFYFHTAWPPSERVCSFPSDHSWNSKGADLPIMECSHSQSYMKCRIYHRVSYVMVILTKYIIGTIRALIEWSPLFKDTGGSQIDGFIFYSVIFTLEYDSTSLIVVGPLVAKRMTWFTSTSGSATSPAFLYNSH